MPISENHHLNDKLSPFYKSLYRPDLAVMDSFGWSGVA